MMKEHLWISSRKKRLSAMIHLPETFKAGTPVVICCHGFTGNKVGYNHLTVNLANFLEQLGYGVLRFDFLGSGDSDGDFSTDTIVSGWQEDLYNVLQWVKRQAEFSASPILLYGHSLGGLVVLTYPDDHRIAARLLFAPVTDPIHNFRDIILGQEFWNKSLAGEKIENFYDRGFTLESQFAQDLNEKNYKPIEAAAKLPTPLLLVHGTADQVVPIQGSRELHQQYQGAKEFVVTDFDHGAVGAQGKLQKIIGDWLARTFFIPAS